MLRAEKTLRQLKIPIQTRPCLTNHYLNLCICFQKLYAVCDVALGLLSKNLTNVVWKDTNVDPALPTKLFTKPDKVRCHRILFLCSRIKWAASSKFGTYRLCEQRRFRRACASAQSRQNLGCLLIQAVSQEEPSDRKPDPWPLWMAGHAQLPFVITEYSKTQIRLTRLKLQSWLFSQLHEASLEYQHMQDKTNKMTCAPREDSN